MNTISITSIVLLGLSTLSFGDRSPVIENARVAVVNNQTDSGFMPAEGFDHWYSKIAHRQRGVLLEDALKTGYLSHIDERDLTAGQSLLTLVPGHLYCTFIGNRKVFEPKDGFFVTTKRIVKGKREYFLLIGGHPREERKNKKLGNLPIDKTILIPLDRPNLVFECEFKFKNLLEVDENRRIILLQNKNSGTVDTIPISWVENSLFSKDFDSWFSERPLSFWGYPSLSWVHRNGYLEHVKTDKKDSGSIYIKDRKVFEPKDRFLEKSIRIVNGKQEYFLLIGGHSVDELPKYTPESGLQTSLSVYSLGLGPVIWIPLDRPNLLFECEFNFRSLVEIDEEKGIILLKRDESDTLDTLPIIWSENPHYSKD